ncbi:C4-dicarboxylate TRAP transporter substrate-binding protein [Rhodococcus sp. H29-C3]|uniref:C4-dicarboxylate TRAP transporter substrate-binding protein n=1 Tax=Rhodococcus sp. H29-C3 TaxID=3046307 RepID=UPI0024B899FB|nr:C4-dicarboxylate TRAP transporter substrate-binding protein [Rhodococcus sp. H29-C3]MDJ0359763.1 C4-dicarboxylate TRAP transporter substrate-binding protein [Rhodococcus sp. H29-C3]
MVVSFALLLAGCSSGGHNITGDSLSEMDPVTLRYADYTGVSSAGPFRSFAKEVAERTDGKITFDEYWGGSLLDGAEMAQGVRGGIADMGMFTPSYYPSEFPMTDWVTELASMVESEYPLGILQGFAANAQFAMTDPLINSQFEEQGMKQLFNWSPISNYDLACKEPVRNLDEARGKRVRSAGGFIDGELEALGMVPVSLPTGEIYEGIQRGVIDCTVASAKIMIALSLWEVATYHIKTPLSGYTQYVVINDDLWNSLPLDAQQAIWDSAYTWFDGYLRAEGVILNQRLQVEGPEHGVQFFDTDPDMSEAVKAYQRRTVESLPSEAPDGLAEPQADIDRYTSLMAEWKERLIGLGYDESTALPDNPKTVDLDLEPYREAVLKNVFDPMRP